MNRARHVIIAVLLLAVMGLCIPETAACIPHIGVYFDKELSYRPVPFVPFEACLYISEYDYYITAVEYRVPFPDNFLILLGTSYPPEMSITHGDPLTGHSIAFWPPLNGYSGPQILCTYQCMTILSCDDWGYTDYPITIEPHPDSGELRGAYAPDHDLFDIYSMTSYLCPSHWPPRLDCVEVLTPKNLKASFDQNVFNFNTIYDDYFWVYRSDDPEDSIAVTAATKLPSSFVDGNADFMVYLESPMEEGVTYILEAYACFECNGCAFSQYEFTFENGFTDKPDLSVTYLLNYDLGFGYDLFFARDDCGPFEFDFRVLNAGAINAGPFTVGISIGDYAVPGSEIVVETISYDGLAVGEFIYETASISLPEGFLQYRNTLIVKVDHFDEVDEWTDSNNELSTWFYFNDYNAEIVSITDVPDDYGGYVEMVFDRSPADTDPSGSDYYNILRLDKSAQEWNLVEEFSAIGNSIYTVNLPTAVDSSSDVEDYWSVFKVLYGRYGYHYISCPDSGYSVDNLGLIAVMLEESSAMYDDSSIRVSWKLYSSDETEPRDIAFFVSRNESGDAFATLTCRVIEHGPGTYSISDFDIEPGREYRYRIEYIESGGRHLLFETDRIAVPATPLTLDQNRPNPFNPSTEINYYLPETGNVTLEIFDVSGRRVRVLVSGIHSSGKYRAEWNGCDDSGSRVASGVYFYRLRAGKKVLTHKMVLMR